MTVDEHSYSKPPSVLSFLTGCDCRGCCLAELKYHEAHPDHYYGTSAIDRILHIHPDLVAERRLDYEVIEDGLGSMWPLCRADCPIEVVRPGKAQCSECEARHF